MAVTQLSEFSVFNASKENRQPHIQRHMARGKLSIHNGAISAAANQSAPTRQFRALLLRMTLILCGVCCITCPGQAATPTPIAPATSSPSLAATTPATGLNRDQAYAQAKALAEIGARLFRDPRFSGSGQMSCSTCHDPGNAFAPTNDRVVQLGGGDLHQPGLRAVPSLKYLQAVPQFSEHFFDSEDEADESVDNGPTGGLTWAGRAESKMDQARIPLFSSFEMGNRSTGDVAKAAQQGGYLDQLAKVLGPAAVKD